MGWHELRKAWHDTTVDYCDVCGNLLIHRYFAFIGDDGKPLRACREDDERIYHKLVEFRLAMVEARAAAGRTVKAR